MTDGPHKQARFRPQMGDARAALTEGDGATEQAGFRQQIAQLAPKFRTVVEAHVIAGSLLAVANAVAIMLTVPFDVPLGLRLRHLAFSALLSVGLVSGFGLIVAAWFRVTKHRGIGWLPLYGLSTWALWGLLGVHLSRQADVPLSARYAHILLPLYLLLCGLAPPAALFVGAACGKLGRWMVGLATLVSLGGVVTAFLILRDDYPGVHGAILWVAVMLFGAVWAVFGRTHWRRGRRRLWVVVAAGVASVGAVCVSPSNAVRVEVFRQPGAVAEWVLARLVWKRPELMATDAAGSPPALTPETSFDWNAGRSHLADRPILVVLTVDALRARAIDDPKLAIPNLRRLMATGRYFTQARSAGAQTSVALTALFSGRSFSEMVWQKFGQGSRQFLYAASDPSPRFVELLSAHGVQTESFLALNFLADEYGVARGFGREQVCAVGRDHASAHAVMRPLLARLKTIKGPALMYAHLMEPHAPYNRGKRKKGAAYDRYLSEIEVVDAWIGRLVQTLKRFHRGRAYLVVSADHGEAFGEHGTEFHTKTLYDELIHVPLLVWGAGIAPRRCEAPVSTMDLSVFSSQVLAIPEAARPTGRGESWLTTCERSATVTVAEGRLRQATVDASGRYKVIEDTLRKTVEIYDLRADPNETKNLFDPQNAQLCQMVSNSRALFARRRVRKPGYRLPYKP